MKLLSIYTLGWAGMVPLAILNGIVREKTYGKVMAELAAHQLSTLIAILLLGTYIHALSVRFPIQSSRQAMAIGGLWLIMTVLFEFIFGHYVMGHAWETLLRDYNLFKGRVWLLVPVWTAVAPYLFFRIQL